MKILILEGIPTSGKSSIAKETAVLLGSDNVAIYSEQKTHEPIMDDTDALHIEFFKSLLEDAINVNKRFAIFDRFYLTQAVRSKAKIKDYSAIEGLLAGQDTLVVYLQVDDATIANRLKLAAEQREVAADEFHWEEHFLAKGGSFDEAAKHYADQQKNYLELLANSKLRYKIFNTTQNEYRSLAKQIIAEWT